MRLFMSSEFLIWQIAADLIVLIGVSLIVKFRPYKYIWSIITPASPIWWLYKTFT